MTINLEIKESLNCTVNLTVTGTPGATEPLKFRVGSQAAKIIVPAGDDIAPSQPCPARTHEGDHRPNPLKAHRFTDEVRENAIEMRAAGLKLKEIAKEIGCHQTTVSGWFRKSQAMKR